MRSFLGWHVRAALRARATDDVVAVGRELDGPEGALDGSCAAPTRSCTWQG
ncbi:MAG: hypothetical protein U0S36_08100 [Candidatus Nanopelagicales bacterium]